ncbi:MAG: MFS transporter [Patescibacteria group bacterium]
MPKHVGVKLSWHERLLLLSFFFFALASPIFFLFTNTFLWKESASPTAMIMYNGGIYSGLIFGFIANRTLLLRVSAHVLYRISCILQGIVPLFLIGFAPRGTVNIVGLGLCFGFSAGLYFANRNFFTSLITQGKHRFAFLSLDQALATVSGVCIPVVVGWYLTFAQTTQHIPTITAYLHAAIFGFVLLFVSAIFFRVPDDVPQHTPRRVFVAHASRRWNAVRLMDFIGGLAHGVFMTIPLVVALTVLSTEVSIGKLQSGATIIGALSIYLVGKYRSKIPHGTLLGVWLLCSTIAGGLVAYVFSTWSVIISAILMGAVGPLYRTSTAHLMYEAVDRESNDDRASYLLDREIFLDGGRVIALIGCGYALLFSFDFTLRYGYLCASVVNAALLIAALRVSRYLRTA